MKFREPFTKVTRSCAYIIWSLCSIFCVADEQPPPAMTDFSWSPEHELGNRNFRVRSILAVSQTRIEAGTAVDLDLWCQGQKGSGTVYNPFFDFAIPLPAQIVLYSADRKFVRALLPKCGSPDIPPAASAWMRISETRTFGATFRVVAGPHPEPAVDGPQAPSRTLYLGKNLPPGKYTLQAVYEPCFTFLKPQAIDGRMKEAEIEGWRKCLQAKQFKDSFRSNTVEIEILRD